MWVDVAVLLTSTHPNKEKVVYIIKTADGRFVKSEKKKKCGYRKKKHAEKCLLFSLLFKVEHGGGWVGAQRG